MTIGQLAAHMRHPGGAGGRAGSCRCAGGGRSAGVGLWRGVLLGVLGPGAGAAVLCGRDGHRRVLHRRPARPAAAPGAGHRHRRDRRVHPDPVPGNRAHRIGFIAWIIPALRTLKTFLRRLPYLVRSGAAHVYLWRVPRQLAAGPGYPGLVTPGISAGGAALVETTSTPVGPGAQNWMIRAAKAVRTRPSTLSSGSAVWSISRAVAVTVVACAP